MELFGLRQPRKDARPIVPLGKLIVAVSAGLCVAALLALMPCIDRMPPKELKRRWTEPLDD